ncbi:MAG: penicillin-binding protein 2 [Nitrospirota bacterium]
MDKRAVILSTAVIFGFAVVVLRLGDLMLLDHQKLAARARHQQLGQEDLRVGRGVIFDRRGRELAVNVDTFSVYCNPRQVRKPRETARALARATGASYATVLRRLISDKGFVWVARNLPPETARTARALGLEGVGFLPEMVRYYPKGALASHVIGFVGVDNQPLEGIELAYDKSLKGRQRKVRVHRDALGRTLSEGVQFDPQANSLVLTLDEGLQYIVEKELAKGVEQWHAAWGTAVMMNPQTGEILAMANVPTYDLNDPGDYPASARRNRAITDTYEPGSTFKVITAAASLEERVVDTTTIFDASQGFIRVGRQAIWDVHNKGILSFGEVLKTSSNVATVMMSEMLPAEALYRYVRGFGFGEETGVDLPGEAAGVVKPPKQWSGTTKAAMSIGYEVAVTPLQLLRAYCAVANGGYMIKPHVVARVISPEGDILYEADKSQGRRAITRRTAAILKTILVGVTQKGGTAMGAHLDGNTVAGKTGTARLVDPETGTYSHKKYAGSFVGFVPADRPRIALIVVLFEPHGKYYGGLVAAPVFREIARQTLAYLNVPREDTFGDDVLVVRTMRKDYH